LPTVSLIYKSLTLNAEEIYNASIVANAQEGHMNLKLALLLHIKDASNARGMESIISTSMKANALKKS